MDKTKVRLDNITNRLANEIIRAEKVALQEVLDLAPQLENLMERVGPGIKGFPLGEPAEAGYTRWRAIVTADGRLWRQDLLSKRSQGSKVRWGNLQPATIQDVVKNFSISDELGLLEHSLETGCSTYAQMQRHSMNQPRQPVPAEA